jgi:hypothetical protein
MSGKQNNLGGNLHIVKQLITTPEWQVILSHHWPSLYNYHIHSINFIFTDRWSHDLLSTLLSCLNALLITVPADVFQ